MVDRRRYRASGHAGAMALEQRPRGLPQVYRGRARKTLRDIYDTDHTDTREGGRFRWLVSTCLAATVGAVAIVVVIFGSMPSKELTGGIMPTLKRLQDGANEPLLIPAVQRNAGLNWAVPKSDRLEAQTGATSTRYVIHETLKQRRDGREYIHAKPYVRLVARLSPVADTYKEHIPQFNPFKLYADSKPISAGGGPAATAGADQNVSVRVVELLGGILPGEDGQELDNSEVAELVEQVQRDEDFATSDAATRDEENSGSENDLTDLGGSGAFDRNITLPNTTVFAKTVLEADLPSDELEGAQRRVVSVGSGQKLSPLLVQNGAATWQAEAMTEAARPIFPDEALEPGQELHLTLIPSLTTPDQFELAKFSIFAPGHVHVLSVTRDEAGEFVASKTPLGSAAAARAVLSGGKNSATTSNLYSSLYYAGLLQNVEPEKILRILRVHAYETDFRKRIGPADTVEFFFDVKDNDALNGPPGELLFTQVKSAGEESKFYRFRTPDGEIDFYDESGNNSKKFLMRRPVRSSGVRLTSGYGLRHHPLLNRRRMHTGVDWAAKRGTPILAAGNGTIEYAARKGHYGNYVRIRHANGYQTSYAHMQKFAKGVRKGVKVRQGQVIGYIGSTGLSSGPHLHFEVLVNKRFVNPMSIKVPRQRQLTGRELIEFRKEKSRIDDLMRRTPVMTTSK